MLPLEAITEDSKVSTAALYDVKNFKLQLAGAILMTLAAGMTAFNCVTALPFSLMCQFCCTTHS
jgi:hypothetical protein